MAFVSFFCFTVGPRRARRARALLENLPQIRRIDGKNTRLLLLLSFADYRRRVSFMLKKSGISGFSLYR